MRTYRFGEILAVAATLALCSSAAGAHTWHISDNSDGKKGVVTDAAAVAAGAGAAAPADKSTPTPLATPKETKATPAAQPKVEPAPTASKTKESAQMSEPYLGASAPPSMTVPTKDADAPAKVGSSVPVQSEKKDSAPPVVSTPSQPPQWDKADMRLSGSMCVACLKELEQNLLKLPGVSKVRVDRPEINYFQPVSPEVSNWAQAIVIFDEHRIDLEYLRGAIRQNGYHSYKVTTKQLNHEPDAKDLRF